MADHEKSQQKSDTEKVKKEHREDDFWMFNCSDKNLFGCFIRKCLDTSITGKLVGMLVVSLLGFTLVIIQNTVALNKIEQGNHQVQRVSIPQYKVTQYILRSINGFKISLLHIMNQQGVSENDRNVLSNQQRLADLEKMVLALKNGGTIMDVAKAAQKTLDVFSVEPTDNTEINKIIDDIIAEYSNLDEAFHLFVDSRLEGRGASAEDELLEELLDSLEDVQEVVTSLAVLINERHEVAFRETAEIISRSQYNSVLTGIGIAIILTIGTFLYILLIVIPLKDILEKIKHIAKGEGDLAQRIEVKTHDEVGQLARQLNYLVDNIFSINSFKAVIEEEESTTEVHLRLAKVLRERYSFEQMFLYELLGSKSSMSVAYSSDIRDVCSTDILDDSNLCRAKRTGHSISSVQFPEICKQFPHADRMEHHCIPMIASGRVLGVSQFLLSKDASQEELRQFEMEVRRAERYIKEATPVIEAKRFASALQETTLKDAMTDLYNRRFLETYTETLVASTLRRKTKVGILMCDMDFFKEVNDTYGHETGDVVLIKTAEVLTSCVRASDFVIRYGGEEFLVLLIDVADRDAIEELAERIRLSMEATVIKIPDGSLQKTVSIGYSEFPGDTEGFWECIKFADVALYRAKDQGRNKVVGFTEDMWEQKEY